MSRKRSAETPPHAASALLASVVVLFAAVSAHAQGAGETRVDPGEIERRIEQIRPRAPARRVPDLAPLSPGKPEVQAEPETAFVLTGVVIEGGTIFAPADLAPRYAEFLAQTIGPVEMEAIAAGITQAYTAAGYFISRAIVPPQQVEGGVLRVRVIEGFLSEIRFEGAEGQSAILDNYKDAMTQDRPARLDTVERGLLLINGLPGVRVLDVRVARLDDEGTYELSIEVSHDIADGSANLDNRGTPEVGRLQAWVSGNLNSALGLGEQLQVSFASVPDSPRELLYGQVGYEQPLGHSGTVLGASLAGSLIDAGGGLASEDTMARSVTIRATARHPLVLSRRQSLYLRAALELHEIKEDRFDSSTIDDSLRVLRVQGDYTLQDDWRGTTYVSAEVSQGLDVLGASDRGDPDLSRSDGDGTFTKFSFDVIRIQEISGPVSLRLAAQAQTALEALLSREEFLIGGSQFGRAYDFGELSGEDGIIGSIELRYGETRDDATVTSYQIYGFYDLGAVWNRNTVSGMSRESLASLGGGVRLGIMQTVQAALEVAQPLTRSVNSTGDDDTRIFFSLNVQF